MPPSSSCWRSFRSRARAASAAGLPGDRGQPHALHPAQHRRHQAALGRDRDRYVDRSIREQPFVGPGHVGLRHVAERRGDRRQHEVVDRYLHRPPLSGWQPLVDPPAQREQLIHHAVGHQVEVRHSSLRLGKPPRDRPPHRRVRNQRRAGRGTRGTAPRPRSSSIIQNGSVLRLPAPRAPGRGRGQCQPARRGAGRYRAPARARPGPAPRQPPRRTAPGPAARSARSARSRPAPPGRSPARSPASGPAGWRTPARSAPPDARWPAPPNAVEVSPLAPERRVDVRVGLARGDQDGNGGADLRGVALAEQEPPDDSGFLGRILDQRLLGLKLRDRRPNAHAVARRHEPVRERRLGSTGQHARHPHDHGHQPVTFPKPSRTRSSPATMSSVVAIAACSSTREIDGDDSAPVTRCTGWSSQSKKRRCTSSASQPP